MAKRVPCLVPSKALGFALPAPKATLHDLRSVRLQRRTSRQSPSPSSSEDKVKAVSNLWSVMKGNLSPRSTNVSLDNSVVLDQGRRLVELLKAESSGGSRCVGRSQRLLYRPQSSPVHSTPRLPDSDTVLTKALRFAVAVAQPKPTLKSRSPRQEGAVLGRRQRRLVSNME